MNTMKTINIPEMNIRICEEIQQKGKSWEEIKIPKGAEICTYDILQKCRNNPKYIDKLHLRDTWEWCQNPDIISKENGYVAGFLANSGRAVLYCIGYPRRSNASLGVRFFWRLKQ